jgi:hypothetical protein
MKSVRYLMMAALMSVVLFACEKDAHIPPDITLKTGVGYTSADATVGKGQSITVGVVGVKKEDDMINYNVSYAYDNATTTTTFQNFSITGSEQQNFNKDVTFTTRNVAGTEKWIFTITDKDGNIAQKSIVLTVQ